MNARKHRKDRRGVVLLILLALLAMFGVVVLTFVVITGHSKRVATDFQRSEEYAIDPQEQLHHAFREVARGSKSPTSSLRQHGLLEDFYGSRTIYGDMRHGPEVTNDDPANYDYVAPPMSVKPICSGQLIAFTPANATKATAYHLTVDAGKTEFVVRNGQHRCVGCVLTMRSGPAANKSTRIVGYDRENNWLIMLPFEGVSTAEFLRDVWGEDRDGNWVLDPGDDRDGDGRLDSNPRHYIINGTPFSGSGFGFNDDPMTAVNAQSLNARLPIVITDPPGDYDPTGEYTNPATNDPLIVQPNAGAIPSLYQTLLSNGGVPYALLPNRTGDPSNTATEHLRGSGHANEDYDAADFQNMALAAVQPNGTVPIPSLHRPALVNYWYYRVVQEWLMPVVGLSEVDAWRTLLQPDRVVAAGVISDPAVAAVVRDAILALKRRVFFRPLPDLHDNFTGSNSRWWQWKAQDIFDTSSNEYPTVTEVRDEYWLGINVRAPTPTRTYLGGLALNGPWDVDNDGDGHLDSIWVDLGFPVRTKSDGRRYKPLFAIHCADLGGRLNLNAHGSVAQTSSFYYRRMALVEVYAPPSPIPIYDYRPGKIGPISDWFEFAAVGNGNWNSSTLSGIVPLPRGLGFGTADVNLFPLFQGFANPIPEYSTLLAMRYGGDGVPGEDALAWNKFFDYDFDDDVTDTTWLDYWGAIWQGTVPNGVFGTPYDLDADGMVALDPGGRPLAIRQSGWNFVYKADGSVATYPSGNPMRVFELDTHPYRFNLTHPSSADAPFTVNDLERVLRPFDRDSAALPDRIAELEPFQQDPDRRNLVTTDQWDVPCPNARLPHDLRGTIGFDWQRAKAAGAAVADSLESLLHASHVVDVLRARVYMERRAEWLAKPPQNCANPDPFGTPPPPVPPFTGADSMSAWVGATASRSQLLAPGLLAGLKMDLNRHFGNGRDDNNNGVIDEAEEAYPGSNRFNEDGDGFLDAVVDQILLPGDPAHPLPDMEEYSGIGSYVEQFYQRLRDGSWAGSTFFDPTGGMDLNGDQDFPTPSYMFPEYIQDLDRHLVRQAYARQLYTLMMIVCDLEEMDRQWDATTDLPNAWPQPPSGLTAAQQDRHNRRALTARKIAQWAVNAVDFRDRDAIMTAFEYDIFPFTNPSAAYGGNPNGSNTWDVNGRLEQDGDDDDLFEDTLHLDRDQDGNYDEAADAALGIPAETIPGDNARAYRGVVWGCERPELLINETLAFHDRRTQNLDADEASPPPGQNPVWSSAGSCDNDFDQLKMPQGSLYVELYNPSSNMEPGPMELYSATNGGVDLTAYAQELETLTQPDGSEQITGGFTAWPVWRLLIVPDTQATADPDGPSGFTPDSDYTRAVYFVDLTQAQVDAAETDGLDDGCGSGASGFRRFGPDYADTDIVVPPIMPGQYAVIGPGEKDTGPTPPEYVTYIGTLDSTASTTAPFSDPSDNNQTRQIRIRPGYASNGSPVRVNPSGIEPAGALNGEAIQPIAGIPINYPNRLSISEATQQNPYPPYPPGTPPGSQECYGDAVSTNMAKDLPLDLDSTLETGITTAVLQAKRTTGTTAQVCVVHLQRLANPLQGYDANANPYRTIDSASIDLTAFTGWWGNTTEQQDDSSCAGMNGTVPMMFSSSQRGEFGGGGHPEDQMHLGINPWVQRLEQRNATDYPSIEENPQTHFFMDFYDFSLDPTVPPVARALQHSLGFLNEPFWPLRDDGNGSTIGPYEGFPELRPPMVPAARPPFPWLTWNNRPFVSQMELMMVPRSSSSRLLNAGIVDPAGTLNVDYFTMNLGGSPYTNQLQPFRHLWNFFFADDNGTPFDVTDDTLPQAHRLLDFVYVPSRFVGTELQGDPAAFTRSGETHPFPPPFSDIPNYREPGRVNINTVFSEDVWKGVMNYFPAMDLTDPAAYWDAMIANRRGYGNIGNPMMILNAASPTRFANPIRSYAGRDSVPLPSIYSGMQQEVNGSMLRSDLISATGQPLFVHGGTGLLLPVPPPPGVPLDLCVHPDRNAYFRYQALQKLGNVITTRSNVYAVWITVGYFEVSEAYNVAGLPAAQFQGMFPEGYQLGPELGSDTGEVKRHRAFYVFDRSIPVGFERGRNNNVEEAILLQRFIE